MKKGLLPIGTVVRLEGGSKNLMITGYYSKAENENKIYQYNACIFPEGFMENTFCLFDHYQIEEVFYEGLMNDEYENYIDNITSKNTGSSGKGLSAPTDSNINSANPRARRKAPTNPLSISEMRAKYTTEKISGGQTEKFDFNKLKK